MENGKWTVNEEYKSGVICALRTFTCEITFKAHMTHDGSEQSKIKSAKSAKSAWN